MDCGDPRVTRLPTSSRRYQPSRSEFYLGRGDVDVDDDSEQEFLCPFCAKEFDIFELFCHFDEEHQVEVNDGVCPICAKRVGMDMVDHVTVQHGNILKISFRKFRRGGSSSLFSILRKELQDANQLLERSSHVLSLSSTGPDPLVSSFIYSSPIAEKSGIDEPHSLTEVRSIKESADDNNVESDEKLLLSDRDREEKAQRCEFVQGLLLSAILDIL
ncbi:hypothetical protein Nepgr_031008 [Nepenthes gracilis]|uniref:Uncharacterized protein n=1 Tax=Nepenthes gracilis TaxID=150966 RepID=A0AAD3TFM3_NEPGR|nr:hypothetical protein Nepgr_031008 [Nepenthes gracilis]